MNTGQHLCQDCCLSMSPDAHWGHHEQAIYPSKPEPPEAEAFRDYAHFLWNVVARVIH